MYSGRSLRTCRWETFASVHIPGNSVTPPAKPCPFSVFSNTLPCSQPHPPRDKHGVITPETHRVYSPPLFRLFCLIPILYDSVSLFRGSLYRITVLTGGKVGWDSSVGIATPYSLDRPGIQSRCRQEFQQLSIPALGPTQPAVQWVPGLIIQGKAAGAWR